MTTKVLIADDQEMVRLGLELIVKSDPELEVAGIAVDGFEALEMARELKPDVCTLDIRMPGLSGLEVTEKLNGAAGHRPAVVIVTTYDHNEYLFQALEHGASGFVLKDSPSEVITTAIHAAAKSDVLISPRLTHRLVDSFVARPADSRALNEFNDREREVLLAVCAGQRNHEIAEQISASTSTVKGYIANLMAKTGADNRVKLVIWVYRNTNVQL